MSHDLVAAVGWWVVRLLLGGGLVLLLAAVLVRLMRQPARRQRIAEAGVVAALLIAGLCLAPPWLEVDLPVPEVPPPPRSGPVPVEATPPFVPFGELLGELPGDDDPEVPLALDPPPPVVEREDQRTAEERARERPGAMSEVLPSPGIKWGMVGRVALGLYLVGFISFLARLAWGWVQLRRFLAATGPAPDRVRSLLAELTAGQRLPRLLVSRWAQVPLSCGVWRPTIVLPTWLAEAGDEAECRLVLAHELTHVRRRDALTALLFALARPLYFVLPWFWWLSRQVRLCQEYVADAVASSGADCAEDYAEFLLRWSQAAIIPAGATGVSGHSSDLFRRITMLVRKPFVVEDRCPRRWSLLAIVLLLSVAVLAAGVGLSQAAPVADDTKKESKDPTKEPAKKEEQKDNKKPQKEDDPFLPGFPDIEDLLKRLPGGIDENTEKMIRQQLEETRKMIEQMRKQIPGGNGGIIPFPQLPQFQPRMGRLNRIPGLGQGATEPRLGVQFSKPSGALVDQLDLPKEQGLIIEELKDDSAAKKAGLKRHDVLLELDGKPVSSDVRELKKQLADIKPDRAVDAVVLRKSKKETIKGLKLPEAKEEPAQPLNRFRFQFPQLGGQGGIPLPGFGNGGGVITMTRTNDGFTASNRDGNVTVTVKGTVENGKAKAQEITVADGDGTKTYDSVDKVPQAHREKAQSLIQAAELGGAFNFRFNR